MKWLWFTPFFCFVVPKSSEHVLWSLKVVAIKQITEDAQMRSEQQLAFVREMSVLTQVPPYCIRIIRIIWAPAKTSDILEQLHQDIDTCYHHETLRNDRGDTKNDDSWYTCSPDFIANIKSSGTMRDTQKTMTISATSFRGCNRFSPLLIWSILKLFRFLWLWWFDVHLF